MHIASKTMWEGVWLQIRRLRVWVPLLSVPFSNQLVLWHCCCYFEVMSWRFFLVIKQIRPNDYLLPFTPFRIFYTQNLGKHGGVLWVTYKTLGSVHLVRQSSSISSSSSKIFSKESLNTLMSVSNSDKLSVEQERGGKVRLEKQKMKLFL